MTGIEIGLLALLFLGKKSPGGQVAPASGSKLLARANQNRAKDWYSFFRAQDAGEALAAGLVRWAGIESSGNPLALSPIGERGLLQCTGTTRKGIYTDAEWAALRSPTTRKEEHARLALKLYRAMWERAKTHIVNPPGDDVGKLWYAKMWHARPKDVIDGKLHGPASMMARDLAIRWRGNAKALERLHSANVVAFGEP